MKSLPDRIGPKAIGSAGFLAMAILGWILADGFAEPVSMKSADVPQPTRFSRPRPARIASARDAATANLSAIRNAADPAERLRATIALANALPVSEFGKWLANGWFSLRDGAELTLFTNILRERWWREDPEGFLLWSIKNDSGRASSTLASWAASQPQQFIDFFKRHPDNPAQLAALADLAKTHPDRALQCLLEMKGDSLFNYELFQTLAEKSPAALETALDSLNDSIKTRVEGILMLARFKTDYAGELRKLLARPDGCEIYFDLASQVEGSYGKIFDDLASLPPKWRGGIAANARNFIDADSAEKWWNADLAGAGFSESEVNYIQTRALQVIAVKNPELALQRLAGLEIRPTESELGIPDDRWETIANALAAQPERTAELIALLTSEEDRRAARNMLERMPERNDSKAAETIETPGQWLAKVTTIDPRTHFDYGYILRSWDSEKLATLGAQFQALPDGQKQQVAQVMVSAVYSFEPNPPLVGEAIRYLLTHPAETPLAEPDDPANKKVLWLGVASAYVGHLAIEEPETARDWIQTLPEGEPKLWAQANLHGLWSHYDPKAADQWFKSLPAATQAEVRKIAK